MVSNVRAALAAIAGGDVRALDLLLTVPPDVVLEAAQNVDLVLSRESLAGVLRMLSHHEVEGTDVQRWASFIRRGYIGRQGGGPVKPITFEYDAWYEDAMADIISRLDEIGDLINGTIPDEVQISMYLAQLGLADAN